MDPLYELMTILCVEQKGGVTSARILEADKKNKRRQGYWTSFFGEGQAIFNAH